MDQRRTQTNGRACMWRQRTLLWVLLYAIAICPWHLLFLSVYGDFHGTKGVEPQLQILPYRIRIASPIVGDDADSHCHRVTDEIVHSFYSARDRDAFMATHGETCHCGASHFHLHLAPVLQLELWKYCMLRLRVATVFLHPDEVTFLVDEAELLASVKTGAAIVAVNPADRDAPPLVHSSFLQLQNAQLARKVTDVMVRSILETEPSHGRLEPLALASAATLLQHSRREPLVLWNLTCIVADTASPDGLSREGLLAPRKCFLRNGYCCNVFIEQEDGSKGSAIALVRHPVQPHRFVDALARDETIMAHQTDSEKNLTCPTFESCVSVVRNRTLPLPELDNFYDILNRSESIPKAKSCNKCLRINGNCNTCKNKCRRYCSQLCKVRPPEKPLTQVWTVHPPKFRRHADRLIPKIVHQTYFEAITPTKYPMLAKLTELWKQSGWTYKFYDDKDAGDFIDMHFPAEVREAFDALVPGALKADLFRYCVLLIQGGLYADVDILLETNLDELLFDDIGFMVPLDSPGGRHQYCVWNGFLASTPGHPFIAKAIEMVVNNVRNRFTVVDVDDMLCPNPDMQVTQLNNAILLTGPCALGAAMNAVLGRPLQSSFRYGNLTVDSDAGGDDIPGRSVVLKQNKSDLGCHRFMWVERNVIVAATDLPSAAADVSNDTHYSHYDFTGLHRSSDVYRDWIKANEVIKIQVSSANRGNQRSTDNDKGSPEELVQQSEARRVNAILLG